MTRGDGRIFNDAPRERDARRLDRIRQFGDDNTAPFNIKSQICPCQQLTAR
jgi:hypothetical protein